MPNIVPISDLRNYSSVLQDVAVGSPVYLTKNGYGSMVVMSIEQYSALTDSIEYKLDEADEYAANHSERLTHDQVFGKVRDRLARH